MMGHYRNGDLVIIGGAEDKYGESSILEEVVDIVGGKMPE
jgi:cyanophycinase